MYELMLCKILSVDIVNQSVELEPISYTHLDYIESKAGEGLKFASSYAPYTRTLSDDNNKAYNTPVGFVNYPQRNDLVLTAIWLTNTADTNRLRQRVSQNKNVEVIIIAKVSWDFPHIDLYDNILGDRSGARIAFNHGWLDETSYIDDEDSDSKVFKPNGHVTQIGNRTTRIAGKKFLGFGMHSHLLGRNKKNRDNTIVSEYGEEVTWKDMFTQDPLDGSLFDAFLSDKDRGNGKFLEPPCPEPSTLMDFHESGYKHLVEINGHVRTYNKGYLGIIGGFDGDGVDDAQAMSFDPENITEPTALNDGEMVLKFIGSSDISHFLVKDNKAVLECAGLCVNMVSSGLPTSITSESNIKETDVEAGKFKIYVDGDLQFTFSAGDNEMVIENDVNIKGNLTVDGSTGIEATAGAIEAKTTVTAGTNIVATTKVVTPEVSDS